VLSGSCRWGCRVSSWLSGVLLAGDVPVMAGSKIVGSASRGTLWLLTLNVPRRSTVDGHGFDWKPRSATHPLARFGQELDVTVIVASSVSGQTWETRRGRFLVTDWDENSDGSIQVTGEGLLRRVSDDRPAVALAPLAGGTLTSEARRLLPPGMGLSVSAALTDRTAPGSMAWSTDRLAALREIAAAWPALLRTDEWGQVVLRPPLADVPTPVLTIRSGARGTLMSATGSDTRSGSANRIVARSSATGAQDVWAVAEQATGPMSATGPYGAVTDEWSSPLLTSVAMAQASAATMLATSVRTASSVPVTCLPDPRIDLDDPVAVITDAGTSDEATAWGWVTGLELPLVATDGAMRVDVAVSA